MGLHETSAAEAFLAGAGLQAVIDADGRILVVNDSWEQFTARVGGDASACGAGANYFDVCRSAADEGDVTAMEVLEACRDTLLDGKPRSLLYRCTAAVGSPSNSLFWYDMRITRLPNQRLLLEHRDVTDRELVADRARAFAEQAAFQHLLLQAIAQPVIATDVAGIVTFWNAAAEELFGYTASEAVGRYIYDVTIPEPSREQAEEIMQVLANGERWTGEFWVRHRDGTRFPARVTDIPMIDADGRLVGIVGVSDDLRPLYAREAAQQRLRELERQLLQSQKLEALGTVAAGVAHEFNNVLAAIVANAEFLREQRIPDVQSREALDGIAEATQRARDVVYALLAYSRPQSGDRIVLDGERWLQSARRLLEPTIAPEITLHVEFIGPPVRVFGNETQLTQVLLNLVNNACYAMRDTPQRVLTITAYGETGPARQEPAGASSDEWFVVDVEDTGVGMDELLSSRVFEPFVTTKPVGEGTGLGLPMVQGLVTAHGGRIEMSSAPASGTRVRIWLPATPAPAPPKRTVSQASPNVARGHLLVVDDDEMVLRALTRLLEVAGYTITAFNDPREALRYVEANGHEAFDAALIDYAMPGIRGDELVRRLSAVGFSRPIVMCTGNASDITQLPAPVCQIVEKPLWSGDLLRIIDLVSGATKR